MVSWGSQRCGLTLQRVISLVRWEGHVGSEETDPGRDFRASDT